MQRFHYFQNDRIQWRWILIRRSGQVKHIVLFMMRSWLHYQKCLWVSTQHLPYLCCSGLNCVSCSFVSHPFPLSGSENEASQLDTWVLDLMTQCSGHRPEPYGAGVKSQIFWGQLGPFWYSNMASDLLTKTWGKNIGNWKSRTEIWGLGLQHSNLSCSLPHQWPSVQWLSSSTPLFSQLTYKSVGKLE